MSYIEIIRWASFIIISIFFLRQGIEDIKTRTVFARANRVLFVILLLFYFIDNYVYGVINILFFITPIIAAIILSFMMKMGIFAIGDFWGYLILMFSVRWFGKTFPRLDIFAFIWCLIIMYTSIFMYYKVIKRKKGRVELPLFPYLGIGYFVGALTYTIFF